MQAQYKIEKLYAGFKRNKTYSSYDIFKLQDNLSHCTSIVGEEVLISVYFNTNIGQHYCYTQVEPGVFINDGCFDIDGRSIDTPSSMMFIGNLEQMVVHSLHVFDNNLLERGRL